MWSQEMITYSPFWYPFLDYIQYCTVFQTSTWLLHLLQTLRWPASSTSRALQLGSVRYEESLIDQFLNTHHALMMGYFSHRSPLFTMLMNLNTWSCLQAKPKSPVSSHPRHVWWPLLSSAAVWLAEHGSYSAIEESDKVMIMIMTWNMKFGVYFPKWLVCWEI